LFSEFCNRFKEFSKVLHGPVRPAHRRRAQRNAGINRPVELARQARHRLLHHVGGGVHGRDLVDALAFRQQPIQHNRHHLRLAAQRSDERL